MVRIYSDTNVPRYFGEAFVASAVPQEIAIQLFLAPLVTLELMSQLGTEGAEGAFAAVQTLPRVHNPTACGVLPWSDDFFRMCLFKLQPGRDIVTRSPQADRIHILPVDALRDPKIAIATLRGIAETAKAAA